ncbi:BTB-POZ domain and WD-repeat protein [Megavirus chiliensis]|nr:putative BTB/POZ domain and WD-repeat protein [Megavirus chiliensis]AEQ33402.1 BTB-POZ domain and WD-repeat protein [Megavirus chiliensis]
MSNKKFNLIKDNLFSDLVLILENFNSNEKITINVHKCILYYSCEYFAIMLSNFQEKNQNEIKIKVPNIHVCYDIIMSFYGEKINSANYPEWKHCIESYKCFDFLGMKFDKNKIYKLKIPSEGFESLLDLIDSMEYTSETLALLIDNMPTDYNIVNLPKDLLFEMQKLLKTRNNISDNIISADYNGTINIWNPLNGNIIKHMKHSKNLSFIDLYPINNQMLSCGEHTDIMRWNYITGEFISRIKLSSKSKSDKSNILCACFLKKSEKIAIVTESGVGIWNIQGGKSQKININMDNIIKIRCSSNDNYIACCNKDGVIKIWNIKENEISTVIGGKNYDICFSSNNKYFAYCDKNIHIYNIIEKTSFFFDTGENIKLYSICFSPDNKYIAYGNKKGTIKILNIKIKSIVELNSHNNIVSSLCYSQDGKYLISGSYDRTIKIWNAISGCLVKTLEGHAEIIKSICVIPHYDTNLIKKLEKYLDQ